MELVTHKKLKGGRLMLWGKAQWSLGQKDLSSWLATPQPLTTTSPSKRAVVP